MSASTCVGAHINVCSCMWRPEDSFVCCFSVIHHLHHLVPFSGKGSIIGLELTYLSSDQSVFASPVLELSGYHIWILEMQFL